MRERFQVSVQRSCRLAMLASIGLVRQEPGTRSKRATASDTGDRHESTTLRYLRVHVMLRREGWAINKKRVWRLYRLAGLQLRMKVKRRKRISAAARSRDAGNGAESALEHGLRPRPKARLRAA